MPKPRKDSSERSGKEQRLFDNLYRVTQQFMAGKAFNPSTFQELKQRLGIPPQHEEMFREVLGQLAHANIIELTNGRYVLKEAQSDIITGVLRVHSRGFGFLQPDDAVKNPQDIFIPRNFTQNAVDGDRVEVVITGEGISDKGPEGRVLAITERTRTHIGGIIKSASEHGDTIAYVPLLGTQQQVIVEPTKEFPVIVGDRVVMEVLEWGTQTKPTVARVSHILGHISDPSCDITAAIEEFDLRSEFPSHAIAEAEAFGTRVSTAEIRTREDLRDTLTVTIDPDTAKDFDDAISIRKENNGHYHLGVHIADVSFYVRPGTALDAEARLRCNSTYFPGTCIPMLPGALSENLCSLKADVNRLTASVHVEFDPQGNMVTYRISRSVIKSSKRFTYREAKAVLEGKKNSPYLPQLQLMVELCGLLKRKRYERGSLEFAMPELVILVDPRSGEPQGTDTVAYDITHQMVEEFMLKANEVVAMHLDQQGKALTYRVHDEPAEENIREFAALAAAFGFKISDKPTPEDLQKLFEEALDTPYGQYLATAFIRSMRLAIYSPENIGHYGLRLTHYCHFTSPIRRYVDLVVHRILFGDSEEIESLDIIAKRCSDQERLSAKAEGSVVMLKKLRLLQKHLAKDPYEEFDAIITRVKPFGFFFEVLKFHVEGFAHVSQLGSDYFIFEEARMRMRGRSTGKLYSSGDSIKVILKDVDLVLAEAVWDLMETATTRDETKPGKRAPKRSSNRRKYAGPNKTSKTTKPTTKKPRRRT